MPEYSDENHLPIIFHTTHAYENVQVMQRHCRNCHSVHHYDSVADSPSLFNFNNRIFFTFEMLFDAFSLRGLRCTSFDQFLSAKAFLYRSIGSDVAARRIIQSSSHNALFMSYLSMRHMCDPIIQDHFRCTCPNGPEYMLFDGVSAGLPTSRGTFTAPDQDPNRHVPCLGPPATRNFLIRNQHNKQIRVRHILN